MHAKLTDVYIRSCAAVILLKKTSLEYEFRITHDSQLTFMCHFVPLQAPACR